jgi:hypothetical protein
MRAARQTADKIGARETPSPKGKSVDPAELHGKKSFAV